MPTRYDDVTAMARDIDSERLVAEPELMPLAIEELRRACSPVTMARMELKVAFGEWLKRIPGFRLAASAEVMWAGGQVRNPRVSDR